MTRTPAERASAQLGCEIEAAHSRATSAWASSKPISGSVGTSRVGKPSASRASHQSKQLWSKESSIQASERPRQNSPIAPSFQCAAVVPADAPVSRWASNSMTGSGPIPVIRESRSFARSCQPVAQTSSNCSARRRIRSAAAIESQCGVPSISSQRATSGGGGDSKPNRLITPSTSIARIGRFSAPAAGWPPEG